MMLFSEWVLFREDRRALVPSSVLQAYEGEFKKALNGVIGRTQDPVLRQKFVEMLDCPLRDTRGGCRSFSDYILSALVKNGVHQQYDIEAALGYVFEKLMMPVSEKGEPRTTLFSGFDADHPDAPQQLQARFMLFLQYAVRNIRKGKVPRLSNTERRPQGTVSIVPGRTAKDEPAAGVSPEQIAARPSDDTDLQELIQDITLLLRQKEKAYPVNLTGLFQSMMAGENVAQQRKQFGDRTARVGRQIIVRTMEEYALSTGNHRLLRLLDQFKDFKANQPSPPRRTLAKPAKPQLAPGKEKDFASILSVIDKLGRPAGTADLGKYRRRWLDYPPREAASGHRNRLEEVLDLMVREGVLRAIKTPKGAFQYEPGPNAGQYRQAVAA